MFENTSQQRKSFPAWVVWIALALVMAKLWMVGGHEFYTKFRPHDDSLFAVLGINLLEGNWLGDYNNKTLIKGVGYPLFIALSSWLGTPLLVLQQVVYALACGVAILALRAVVVQPVSLLLAFGFLLFNPLTYNYPLMSQMMRESLYLSLILWVFASLLGLWNARLKGIRASLAWSVSLAVSFTWMWITREESVWILPAILLFVLAYLLPLRWNQGSPVGIRLGALLLPLLIFTSMHFFIIAKNEAHYGVAITNELKAAEFSEALGGLMRIRHEKLQPQVIVSADAQEKAFRVSPAFAELEPFLSRESRMIASFYIWRLRSAVRKAGYYDDPSDATRTFGFYRRMGEEINAACDRGELDCYDRAPSIRPVWHATYWREIAPVFGELSVQALTGALFNASSVETESEEDMDTLFNFDVLTGEHTLRQSRYFKTKLPNYYQQQRALKEKFMSLAGVIYKWLVPLLFAVALLVHVWQLLRMLNRRELSAAPVLGLMLLGSIVALLAMLTYVKITIWPVYRPLHAVSPVILFYIVYMLTPNRE